MNLPRLTIYEWRELAVAVGGFAVGTIALGAILAWWIYLALTLGA